MDPPDRIDAPPPDLGRREGARPRAPLAPAHALAAVRRMLPKGHALPESLWMSRHRAVLIVLWGSVLALFLFALARGNSFAHAVVEAGAPALPAAVASVPGLNRRVRMVAATLGVSTASAVLVHLSGGTIEAHFAFFAMISLITLYQSWLPLAVATGYVLLHHGIMGVLHPEDVYNHPAAINGPWRWAAIHALAIFGASLTALYSWRVNEEASAVRGQALQQLDAEEARRRQALEINDDVVQALVVAQLALDLDERDTAREALVSSLRSARAIVAGLLAAEGAGPSPDLVRSTHARVGSHHARRGDARG